ncbi:MAG: LPS-assembly protein LptD [Candidatus Omnitrophica bacterium]|nr:LPS-assembly protein LptD [Candidatus Omnitrophota bacterium]
MVIRAKKCLFLFFLFCGFIFAEEIPVYYSSDNFSVKFNKAGESEEIILNGNVKISFSDTAITCEKAVFNRITGDISADGPVYVETPEATFTADYITHNLNSETGILLNSSFKAPPVYGKADKVEKREGIIILKNGYITACDLEKPHYRISAENMEYVPGDYLRAEKLRLVFGEKYTLLYLPGFTIDARTKEPPFSVMPGYSTRVGRTVDAFFTHRAGDETDAVVKERISLGGEGIGAGMKVSSRKNRYRLEGFLYKRWDDVGLEPGLVAEFNKNYSSRSGEGNFILNWRLMDSRDLFYDFFNDDYDAKSKTYNYLSATHNFKAGIFNLNFRHSADENFLNVEKIPEVRFRTPFLRMGNSPLFVENDFRLTNFYKEGEECLRAADRVKVSVSSLTGLFSVSPYISAAGINYSGSMEDRFNFMSEAGVKVSAAMKKQHEGYTGYFSPSLSVFYRGLDYEAGEIEYFDGLERLNGGRFVNLGLDWFFHGKTEYLGRVSVENVYDIDRGAFDGNLLKYDARINPRLHIEGQNEFSFSEGEYRFGVNDLVADFGKYSYSIGNRYDGESGISGIEGRFGHALNENWRYGIGAQYDIESGGFSRAKLDVWRKLHCWEMHFRISADEDDFSFYLVAYPIFLM